MDMEGKEKQLEDWLLQVFPHLGSRPGGMERKKSRGQFTTAVPVG